MERQGSGLNKICTTYENAVNYQKDKKPVFSSNRVEFVVKLPNLNFKASNAEALNDALNDALNATQNEILDLISKNSKITQKEIGEYTGFSRSTVQRGIKYLQTMGYIERVGSRKQGSWIRIVRE